MSVPGTALFVYGTLMDAELRVALLGRDLPACDAHLDGFARVFPPHLAGYADIVPSDGERVDGVLLEQVDADSLSTLDTYEEVGHLYDRRPVEVTAGGRRVHCEAYVGISPPR